MVEQAYPIIALISQRMAALPGQAQAVGAAGKTVAIRRYREGQTDAASFRADMVRLGYSDGEITQTLVQANLEREYDTYTDRLATVKEAFAKRQITDAEMVALMLDLVVDDDKRDTLITLWRFQASPKAAAATAAAPKQLTEAKLAAAWKEGIITTEEWFDELVERGYTQEDAKILIDTEIAKLA